MIEIGHGVELDRPSSIGERALGAQRLDLKWLLGHRKSVRIDRMRCRRSPFEKSSIGLVRDDRRPFVDRGPNTAQVVPVMMHGDDVADRLVGNEFLGFRDHG